MKHHPDFYAEDDARPQFGALSFEKQQEIICDLFGSYILYPDIAEAISQMKPDSTVSDLLLYIAKCIEKHYPQNDWCI